MSNKLDDLWPIAIIQDRYLGSYANGKWFAIANADMSTDVGSRAEFCLTSGPHGDDVTAMNFWYEAPDWIAVGNSPEEAINNLTRKAA